MISSRKGPAPACLTVLAATPGADWDSVHGDQKQEMRDGLVRDQGAVCAYCQRRVRPSEQAMRIDHWHPREAGGGVFQWSNLVGSCATRGTCDDAKHETRLFLHPVRGQGPDPRVFLRYLGSGDVIADEPRAQADLEVLNLNERALRRGRREVHEALARWIERHKPTTAELHRRIRELENPGGELDEFAGVRAYHLRRWARSRGVAAPLE